METPMAYAVSDTPRRDARNSRVIASLRPKIRRPARRIAIHWPRVIAVGLNTLVWVGVIAIVQRALHH
jgi:hypothetical protein